MNRDRRQGRQARIQSTLEWFERYHGLVGDVPAFIEVLESPPPIDLLIAGSGDEAEVERVEALLSRRGAACRRFPWAPRHLRVEAKAAPGPLPEVVYGLAFRQGVVSALPCQALAPQPGEKILDVCAAPGGKTVMLAQLAEDRGRILAGDPSAQRAGVLVQSLSRMGIASTIVVQQDGNRFPAAGPFDAILLDAPCTGEGTFRIPKPRYEPTGERGILRSRALQVRLLSRALDLLAPGGRLAYSTCTFAPEENESVLTEVLNRREDMQVLELPAEMPGSPGLDRWRDRRFDPRLKRARRLYPHLTGSWGFFLCLLGKDPASGRFTAGGPHTQNSPRRPEDDPEARQDLLAALERFGLGEEELGEYLVAPRAQDLWILSRLDEGREDVDISRLQIVAPGLRALRRGGRTPRLTNTAMRCLGPRMTKLVVELSWEQAVRLLEEKTMPTPGDLPRGQVLLAAEGRAIAAGYVHGQTLTLEIPKAWC